MSDSPCKNAESALNDEVTNLAATCNDIQDEFAASEKKCEQLIEALKRGQQREADVVFKSLSKQLAALTSQLQAQKARAVALARYVKTVEEMAASQKPNIEGFEDFDSVAKRYRYHVLGADATNSLRAQRIKNASKRPKTGLTDRRSISDYGENDAASRTERELIDCLSTPAASLNNETKMTLKVEAKVQKLPTDGTVNRKPDPRVKETLPFTEARQVWEKTTVYRPHKYCCQVKAMQEVANVERPAEVEDFMPRNRPAKSVALHNRSTPPNFEEQTRKFGNVADYADEEDTMEIKKMAREESDHLADAREIYEPCDDYRDMNRRRLSQGSWNWTHWERRFKRYFWFVLLSTLLFIFYAIGGAIFDNMKIPIDDCDQARYLCDRYRTCCFSSCGSSRWRLLLNQLLGSTDFDSSYDSDGIQIV